MHPNIRAFSTVQPNAIGNAHVARNPSAYGPHPHREIFRSAQTFGNGIGEQLLARRRLQQGKQQQWQQQQPSGHPPKVADPFFHSMLDVRCSMFKKPDPS
jgi:hypothetical protein